jgi:uncharacterized protein (DUF427 family)
MSGVPESVWDFPRPPTVRACASLIEVWLGGVAICRTNQSWQVLETSHPPTYYLPRAAFAPEALREAEGSSWCEWKGQARYLDVVGGSQVASHAGWSYPQPHEPYAMLVDHVAVYAGPMDEVRVDGEVVRPQPGGFYGGWITSAVTGPFKGVPGSRGW